MDDDEVLEESFKNFTNAEISKLTDFVNKDNHDDKKPLYYEYVGIKYKIYLKWYKITISLIFH